ncbi:hypothetical protein QBC45DRAFT_7909 [Copromyces sp. CBS 386.78]|nr:hypothetical protein QBC45DRAFT_7909 [Copromyces sp. CBS 386.78]
MAQPLSLNTNNPFRRKQAGASTTSTPISNLPNPLASDAFADAFDPLPTSSSSSLDPTRPALPSSDDFRNSLQSLGQSNEPPPKTSFQKPKVVKKVRVQSPPPSPESDEEPDTYPPAEEDTTGSSSSDDDEDGGADPFAQAGEGFPPTLSQPELPGSSRVPPNPFGRTLEDLEHPTNESPHSPGTLPGGKGSLDVDSFRRLLLTGQAGEPMQPPRTDGASITDASSTLTAQDTPRTSHEISEHEREESQSQRTPMGGPVRPTIQTPASSRSKAPPPPPSSRHGKLIKVELKGEERSGTPGTPRPLSSSARAYQILASPFSEQPSDVNKPLPPPPVRSPGKEDLESPFDGEAAGKLPEMDQGTNAPTARPPTPPKPTVATPPPSQAPRKPPPPPRRSAYGRSESKVSVPGSVSTPVATPQTSRLDEEPTRTSVDSTRSRSSSLKASSSTTHVNAPAPPPPRRSTHGPRPSTSTAGLGMGISSPVAASAGAEGTDFPGLAAQPVSESTQRSRPSTPANTNSNNPETATISSFNQPGHGRTFSGSGRLAPPPPPPARNKSVRSGTPSTPGTTVRRADSGRSKEPIGLTSPAPIAPSPNHAPPPPPRPRPRGSNRRSVSGSGSVGSGNPALGTGSVESPAPVHPPPAVPASGLGGAGARFLEASLALGEEPRGIPDGELASVDLDEEDVLRRESAAKDILADLDALQREVDALRAAQEQGRT